MEPQSLFPGSQFNVFFYVQYINVRITGFGILPDAGWVRIF